MDRLFNKAAKISISFRNGKFISESREDGTLHPSISEPLDKTSESGVINMADPIVAKKVIGSVDRVENNSLIIKFDGGIDGVKYIQVTYSDIELIDFHPIVN